jgi:hypothetical protein
MLAKLELVVRAAVLLMLVVGGSAGCGGGAASRPVRLDIAAPTDAAVVRENSVEVRGRVQPPRARVLVAGRPATVLNGEFHTRVPLREGSNLIDVGASAGGNAPAWGAVRVARESLVTVPDLAGAPRDDAVAQLKGLGLRPRVAEKGGLLEKLLPVEWQVCQIRPEPGTELPKGARVRLFVSKTC